MWMHVREKQQSHFDVPGQGADSRVSGYIMAMYYL